MPRYSASDRKEFAEKTLLNPSFHSLIKNNDADNIKSLTLFSVLYGIGCTVNEIRLVFKEYDRPCQQLNEIYWLLAAFPINERDIESINTILVKLGLAPLGSRENSK